MESPPTTEPDTSAVSTSNTADRIGIAASGACAVHCAASALVPSLLGVLGLGALLGHEAEWAFSITAAVVAAAALWHGWRVHRSTPVMAAFAAGITALLMSRFVEEAGIEGIGSFLGIGAGILLVWAHVSNIRATRSLAR